jgi:cyclin B
MSSSGAENDEHVDIVNDTLAARMSQLRVTESDHVTKGAAITPTVQASGGWEMPVQPIGNVRASNRSFNGSDISNIIANGRAPQKEKMESLQSEKEERMESGPTPTESKTDSSLPAPVPPAITGGSASAVPHAGAPFIEHSIQVLAGLMVVGKRVKFDGPQNICQNLGVGMSGQHAMTTGIVEEVSQGGKPMCKVLFDVTGSSCWVNSEHLTHSIDEYPSRNEGTRHVASVVSNVEALRHHYLWIMIEDMIEDTDDVQACGEYARDIFRTYEQNQATVPNYMALQANINATMRAMVIDWLGGYLRKYTTRIDTLFLAVNLMDRFLGQCLISRRNLQLVGVVAMLIAAKFEEIHPPEIRDFVRVTDNAYTSDEIKHMEVSMLAALEFKVCAVTAAQFFHRYAKINNCTDLHSHLFNYILELSLLDIRMMRYPPSHVAAAACLLSNKLLRQRPSWPAAMVGKTKLSEQMLKPCAKELCGLLERAEGSKLQAIRKKFAQASYSGVASFVEALKA